jgi:ABC-type Zn uptake system ZnuABC Zn-binding protein ZnuA
MTRQRVLITTAILLLIAILALPAIPPRSQAQGDRLNVIASFSILADVVAQVAGEDAAVTSLMPVGANPHAYSPSAQDVAALSDADLVFVVGANYEEGLLPVLREAAGANVVAASQCVPIRPISGVVDPDHHAEQHDGEHNGERGHEEPVRFGAPCDTHYEAVAAAFDQDAAALLSGTLGPLNTLACPGDVHHDEKDEHAHDPGSCDPHVWTDPLNAALWTLTIRDTLAARDPDHADAYAANAERYLGELAALDAEVRALIETIPADRRAIITNHAAFNYFAARYGLELVGVVIPGGSTTSEPSVQEVLRLIETVQAHHVAAIFTETTVSEALARQIADETGAALVPLYTGSLSQPEDGAGTYLDYIRFNAATIAEALR